MALKRFWPLAAALLAAGAVVLGAALVLGADARGRLDAALDRMDGLAGVRFEMVASARATGQYAVGGEVLTSIRGSGRLVPPDRLQLSIESAGRRRDVLVIGQRTWIDDGGGYRQSIRLAVGPLRDARSALNFVRGSGAASFAGFGIVRGAATYRIRIDLDAGDLASRLLPGEAVPPDAKGIIEVDIGLLDGLVHRQSLDIVESADPFAAGLSAVRTTYAIEYWEHGRRLEIREPD